METCPPYSSVSWQLVGTVRCDTIEAVRMAEMLARKKRVLVIDDEEKFCKIVAEFLQGRHYEVATASKSSEALHQLDPFAHTERVDTADAR